MYSQYNLETNASDVETKHGVERPYHPNRSYEKRKRAKNIEMLSMANIPAKWRMSKPPKCRPARIARTDRQAVLLASAKRACLNAERGTQ